MQFRVEYISGDPNRPFLLAKQLGNSEFALSASSTLGGIAISPNFSVPRKLNPDGTQDLTVFAFQLQSADNLSQFSVGQVVTLQDLG